MKRKVDELQGRGRLLSPSHPPQLHPSLVPPQASSSDLDFGILAGFCLCTLKTTVNSPGTCTSLQKTSCTCLEFRPCSAGNGSTSHPAAVESSADCSFWKWMRSSGVWCSQLENHHTPHTHRSLSSSFSFFCCKSVRVLSLNCPTLLLPLLNPSSLHPQLLPTSLLRSSPHIICIGINGHSPPSTISFSPFVSSFPALLPSLSHCAAFCCLLFSCTLKAENTSRMQTG